jgi:Fe-S-cluster-containing dehydrogenase component/anaerobic selenocysteine-containing dehydrogenase
MSEERRYWQCVDELDAPGAPAHDPDLAARRRLEFGSGTLWQELGQIASTPESRRDFLKLMGFTLSAATLASCTKIPERRAIPLVSQPEELVPGVPAFYATTCAGCAAGCGLLVKTRDGRPIKIEGNPLSPLSGGGTCAVGQATVLSLYDERRLAGPVLHGKPASWEEVDAFVGERLAAVAARGGPIVLLTGTLHGPATRQLLTDWMARFPTARHVAYDAISLAGLRYANEASFGAPVVPRYRLDRARVIVGIEADFLGTWLSPVELTRRYARGRQPAGAGQPAAMSRHVQIEAGMSLTGSNADLRLPVLPSDLAAAAVAILAGVARRAGAGLPAATGSEDAPKLPPAELDAVAAELWAARGESLVLCGVNDVPLQLVVNRINALLGNVGRTIDLDNPSFQAQGDDRAMAALLGEMERGEVAALFLWGVNPAYDHPDAARFVEGLARVPLAVSFADRLDETAAHATAVCPDHHFLEAWGDAEPVGGSLGLAQPVIAPLFATRAAPESLLRWMGRDGDFHGYLREHWRREIFPRQSKWPGFDDFWDHALQDGAVSLPEVESRQPVDRADLAPALAAISAERREAAAMRRQGGWEVRLHPKVALRDGRHANNPWLQELPDPVTKVTWGNYASLAPADAARLAIAEGDVVAIDAGPIRLELPVQVQPGQPAGAVSIALGYGRRGAGRVGDGVGANAFPLVAVRDGGLLRGWMAGARLAATGRREPLAATQTHHSMEGRAIVRELKLGELGPSAGAAVPAEAATLWGEYVKEGHFWGMSIDLNACTGCAACVIACQAENNVAVVGRDEVRRGREMHWIRVDRYYSGSSEHPDTAYQPMMCQQCDHAPCETVCPVLATVHSSDGLNQQVYNRCVGTRYCANNCPYKVRRFNWFQYAGNDRFDYTMHGDLARMVLNPDVVVRSRGVMEKCSMCIQRIQAGKLEAERQGRPPTDGDIATACQQACPADAIVFGDRNDRGSRLAGQEDDPRSYRVLAELGTRPGVG